MHALDAAGIVEQIVAIERPLIEGRGIVRADRSVIEQERRPAQAVQHNPVFARHAPPRRRRDRHQAGGIPFIGQGFAVEAVDGGKDHLPPGNGKRRGAAAAPLGRHRIHGAQMGEKRLFAKAQGRRQHEFGALPCQVLQPRYAAVGQHAVGREDHRIGLVAVRHVARLAMPGAHMLAAVDAGRARWNLDIDGLDVTFEQPEHVGFAHRRPIVRARRDQELAAARGVERRNIAGGECARQAKFQKAIAKRSPHSTTIK